MLVAIVVGVDRDGRVAQHRFDTRRAHLEAPAAVRQRVHEARDHSELDALRVAGHSEQRASVHLLLLDLRPQLNTNTIDE